MNWKRRAGLLAVLLAFLPGFMLAMLPVWAASGTVYSCTINRCYAHPVTGAIEDPGGEASYTTGQGMVEGVVGGSGMMEVTSSGEYYLTFRISLVDYTSDCSFSVQNAGDSGWSDVTPTVTANGSDSNGATSDLCIRVPSENCIIRSSMYVTPMGRDVIFYFYPNNYTEGNSVGMTASVVTENAASKSETAETDGNDASKTETDKNAQNGNSEEQLGATEEGASVPMPEQTTSALAPEVRETGINSQVASNTEQAASPTVGDDSDSALSSAQGLSLSTAEDVEEEAKSSGGGTNIGMVNLVVAITASITISGLILMTAAAAIVCYFRKNWRRWGGYDSEEYDDEDE